MSKIKVLVVIGTRPEAIKMAPLVIRMKQEPGIQCVICTTSQHKEMLKNTLDGFDIQADFDLEIMRPRQSLSGITIRVLQELEPIIIKVKPDLLLVQGDTTTTLAASLAAFYHQIKIGHVEAGLRTYDKTAPFPEELNRQMVSRMADLHFAPTPMAVQNLIQEGIPESKILLTGNTVIDALVLTLKTLSALKGPELHARFPELSHEIWENLQENSKKLILVTTHRRENLAQGIGEIAKAVLALSTREDVFIIFPVHLNPEVREQVEPILSDHRNIFLLNPLNYLTFVFLMSKSYLIITDSGGIQEEAPFLGKPVLVARTATERPESVAGNAAILVGTQAQFIIKQAHLLLDNPAEYLKMTDSGKLFGDGNASEQIVKAILHYHFIRES